MQLFLSASKNEDIFFCETFHGKNALSLIIPRADFLRGCGAFISSNYLHRRKDIKLKIKNDILYANERDF